MPLNAKIEIKSTGGIHGYAWFAKEVIARGEWLWKKRADDAPTTDTLPKLKQATVVLQEEHDKEPLYDELIESYINHSCNGCAWYEGAGADLLIAKRKIEVGEEIRCDYALTKNHPSFVIENCLCGDDEHCRGRITGNDWQLLRLQRTYGQHFAPHIQKDVDVWYGMTRSLRELKKGFNALLDFGGSHEFSDQCEKVWATIQANPTVKVDTDEDMEYVDPDLTERCLQPEHAWFRILEYGRAQKEKLCIA